MDAGYTPNLVRIARRLTAQVAWKAARSDERWEIRAERQMAVFSQVYVMLPSQITHLKGQASEKNED